MLDISKLKTGTEEFDFRPNDMTKLVRDVVDEFSQSRKNISLEAPNNFKAGNFRTLANTVVNCDSIRMLRVLRALISNAIRYSQADTPIVVKVEVIKDGSTDNSKDNGQGKDGGSNNNGSGADVLGRSDLLRVSVTDQGVGVPEDEKYNIFKPFYESTRTRCFSGGTGLGLSAAREIVDGHGGKIWAEVNEVGTTFAFTIPRNMIQQDQLCQNAMKLLVEQWPGHLYLKDANYVFRACNQEQVEASGATSTQELLGKTNRELLGEEIGKRVDAVDRRVLEGGESIEVEEVTADGQYYLSRKAPVIDADNKIIGLIGTSMNITKLKTTEFGLRKDNEELSKKTDELAKENAELRKALQAAGVAGDTRRSNLR